MNELGDEIRLPVRMLIPKSLNEAFSLAKIQEEYLLICKKSFSRTMIDSGKPSILGLPKFEGKGDTRG